MTKWMAIWGVMIMSPLFIQALTCYQCHTEGEPEAEAQKCREAHAKFVTTCNSDETCLKTVRYSNETGTNEEVIVRACAWLAGHPAKDECRRPWGEAWKPVDPTKKMNINCRCLVDLCNRAAHADFPALFLLVLYLIQYMTKP